MKKLLAILLGVGISASYGAITVTPVGDGSGYDEVGMDDFRSSSVAKGFDGDGDNIYGTEGNYFTGDGTTVGNGLTPAYTQTGASWASFANGANLVNFTANDTGAYGTIDNPTLSGETVDDWNYVGISIATAAAGGGTSAVGAWSEILLFDINGAPENFRIGLLTGKQSTADGRWDPTGLRLTVDGGMSAEVLDIPNNGNTDSGWVFFDVDLNGAPNGRLIIEGQQRLAGQGVSLVGVTFDTIVLPDNAYLTLSASDVSLDLVAPDTTVNAAVTASYNAGQAASGDITIISAVADSGFSASLTDPVLGSSDLEEVITVTYDNAVIGLANGESTNSTLEIIWQESGGVVNTSSIPLDVTYINEPNRFDLTPASLSFTLYNPETSVDGTIVASYIEGTIPAAVEIISVVATNGFSVDPSSFILSSGNTNQTITVTYSNTGALVKHGDTAESAVVVTWTETGSGVTNTVNGSVDVFYYSPTVNAMLIAGYDFDDGTGTETTDVTDYNQYVVASGYGVGTGLVSVISANGNALFEEVDAEGNLFGTTNGISFGSASSSLLYTLMNDEDNLALAMTNADYMVFTVSVNDDYVMDLTSFTFRSRVNQLVSSAERWALFSSVGGFESPGDAIATGQTTVTHTYVNNVVDLSAAAFQNLDGEVEFRLYIYGGASGYSSATMFDKVVLNGRVYGLDVPPFSASMVEGALIMSWADGRSYNVLTNSDLAYGSWEMSKTGVPSPVTNAVSEEAVLFFKLGK
ncbi:hypothetical protein P4C99_09020 [Pontiellaceae bacterium B1224]|nr:hypothetical protein [Pontiellaceae bacterium B1224]